MIVVEDGLIKDTSVEGKIKFIGPRILLSDAGNEKLYIKLLNDCANDRTGYIKKANKELKVEEKKRKRNILKRYFKRTYKFYKAIIVPYKNFICESLRRWS